MSELWLFVYIESHVILHAKADAQKVNCLLVRNHSLEKVMKVVSSEVTSLCSKANPLILKKTGKKDLEKFDIEDVCKERHERAQAFHSFLLTSAVNKNTKNSRRFGSLAVAGSILLKQRTCEMSATAAIVGVLPKSKAVEVRF